MAICKSATRFDKDSYYETTVDESNDDVVVKGTKNGEPVEWSLGGGGGDLMMVVNIHRDTISHDYDSIDKTFNELKSAIENGVPIYARVLYGHNDDIISISNVNLVVLQLLAQYGQNDRISFEVSSCTTAEGKITGIVTTDFHLLSDDTFTVEESRAEFTGA